MIMTFEFALIAQKDATLMRKINIAMASQNNEVVCTDIHKLSFIPSKQAVIVNALSNNSPFYYKIVPKEIKYSAVVKMLNNDWENISNDEIIDID